MISDEELLSTVVRESLHKLYPATEVGVVDFPPPRARLRFGYVVYGALTAVLIATIAVGSALLAHTSHRGSPAPVPVASVTATPSPSPVAAPAWAQVCIPLGVPADQFVGLTFAAAQRLASPQNITLIIVGLDGRCIPLGTKVYTNPVFVATSGGIVVEARYEGWSGPPK
jgi:hypothetical protein